MDRLKKSRSALKWGATCKELLTDCLHPDIIYTHEDRRDNTQVNDCIVTSASVHWTLNYVLHQQPNMFHCNKLWITRSLAEWWTFWLLWGILLLLSHISKIKADRSYQLKYEILWSLSLMCLISSANRHLTLKRQNPQCTTLCSNWFTL